MKKPVLVFAVLLLAVGGGWGLFAAGHGQAQPGGAPGEMPPQAVATLVIQKQNMTVTRELPGRISPFRQSQIRPQVDGIITQRLFEEGAEVAQGDQLYQIDDARYKAALSSALADLKSAQASVKTVEAKARRYEELAEAGAVSQQEYDDAAAQLDQARAAIAVAQAAVDVAKVNLGYTKVYAPIAGRISRSYVSEGALVSANQTQEMAVITQLDPVYIDMQESGEQTMTLRARMAAGGQDKAIAVHLTLDEKTKQPYAQVGTLQFSEVRVDEATGSVALRAQMPNPDGILLPGLFVRARIDLGQEAAILVPQRAAIRMPDGSLSVWVVDGNNQAQMRPISVSESYGEDWVVTDGLVPGDQVIVEGTMKLGPGAKVAPSPWKEPESGAQTSGGRE